MFYVKVIMDKSNNSLFKEFEYIIHESDYYKISIGSVVEVEFNRSNRKAFVTYKGVFITSKYKLKYIKSVVNERGFNTYQQELFDIICHQSVTNKINIFNYFIKSTDKDLKYKDNMRLELAYEYVNDYEFDNEYDNLLLDSIKEHSIVSKRKLRNQIELKEHKINKLIKKGCIEKRNVIYEYNSDIQNKNISYKHVNIIDKITSNMTLVMPGSNSFDIINELCSDAILNNSQILIVIPDVAASYDIYSKINANYISKTIMINKFSTKKELQYYDYLIENNKVNIIIGTKKSMFMPFVKLKTIIFYAAHSSNYYNHVEPFFNYIEVLEAMKIDRKIMLTNTPSILQYSKCKKHKYDLIKLDSAISNVQISEINDYEQLISVDNLITIKKVIESKKKVLLYYNYNGFSSNVKCSNCGTFVMCPICKTLLRYDKEKDLLFCNQCNYTYKLDNCNICKSTDFSFQGIGIQKVFDIVSQYYDKVCILDGGQVAKIDDYKNTMSKINSSDIIIATQASINIDIEQIGYAIIMNVDAVFYNKNTYLIEKTYQDITSIINKTTHVSVQTKFANHYIFSTLCNYDSFYQTELQYRKINKEIPYFNICNIYSTSINIHKLTHFNETIIIFFKNKNIICDKVNEFNINGEYTQVIRIKYKKEIINEILHNIKNNANSENIKVTIKDKFNFFT